MGKLKLSVSLLRDVVNSPDQELDYAYRCADVRFDDES